MAFPHPRKPMLALFKKRDAAGAVSPTPPWAAKNHKSAPAKSAIKPAMGRLR